MYVSSNKKDWDIFIPPVLFAYRVTHSASTKESPFFMLYGRDPRLPMDCSFLHPIDASSAIQEHRQRVVQEVSEAQSSIQQGIQKTQQCMKDYYDKKVTTSTFDIGDKVWVYSPKHKIGLIKKLLHNWHGPYRIVAKPSPVTYKLRTTANIPVGPLVHFNRMKLYTDPGARPISTPSAETEEPLLLLPLGAYQMIVFHQFNAPPRVLISFLNP